MKPLAGKKKIVRSSEVQDNENKLREGVIALGDDVVESLRFALQHELDGRLAYKLLKDFGVIQTRAPVQLNNQSEVTEEQVEKNLTGEWMMKLDLMALEKSREYGMELPEGLEERVNGYFQSQPDRCSVQNVDHLAAEPSQRRTRDS
jgi:hypothetical protein